MKSVDRVRLISTSCLLLLSLFWQLPSIRGQVSDNKKKPAAHTDHQAGVIVEKVGRYSEAEKAEFQEGDSLLGWSSRYAQGEVASPFDVARIEIEQAPRGTVKLEGLRGGEKRTWVLGPGEWGLKTRPNLPPDLLSVYQEGQDLAKAGKLAEAAERWRIAAGKVNASVPGWLHLWFLLHAADAFAEGRQWKEADAAYEDVIQKGGGAGLEIRMHLLRTWAKAFEERADSATAEKYYQQAAEEYQKAGSETLVLADLLDRLGLSALRHADLPTAGKSYRQAMEIQQRLAPGSLSLANTLYGLGNLARTHGDLAKAEEDLRQALELQQKLAPGSLPVAASLDRLGILAWQRGDLAKADEYGRQALAIAQRLAPDTIDHARPLSGLGLIAWSRGDLAQAEEYQRQVLAIYEKLTPVSPNTGSTLMNLGNVSRDRGDLAKAEDYFSRALTMDEKLAPGSDNVALALANLGGVALDRGDLAKAEQYLRKSLAIQEKISPGSAYVAERLTLLGSIALARGDLAGAKDDYQQSLTILEKTAPGSRFVAGNLYNLGIVSRDLGDLAKAEEYQKQALGIQQKVAPASLDVAETLDSLGAVAARRGDFTKSDELLGQSLAIREKLAPDSLVVAESFGNLGSVARDSGDLEKAKEYYRRSLAIQERLAPESTRHAETLADLAGIMLRQRQLDAAAPLFDQALRALESQINRLGGSEETRLGFRARHLSYYRDYVALLMRLHDQRPGEGFNAKALETSERGRARELLELLNESHAEIRQGVEPALLQQERSVRTALRAKRAYQIRLLAGRHTPEEVSKVEIEISALVKDWETTEAEIRAKSPRYAALTEPQPLKISEIQRLLDPETLLLEYSLNDDRSFLWLVTPDSLASYELPRRTEVESVARRAYEELSANNLPVRTQASRALSRMLLDPVAGRLANKRLVVVADGALQYIPFGALRSSRGMPLIAEHEIVTLPSASTLAILRQEMEGRSAAPKLAVVLADPVFSPDDPRVSPTSQARLHALPSDKLERSAQDTGLVNFDRLVASRREADAIVALAGEHLSKEALDFDASLETATSPDLSQYRIVHFATHALLNSQHPELSGIVLSLVDRQGRPQDGFMQAQEVYNLRLNADLVVLSACQTALGKEVEGEGLIGLTRGFMYAGAPRVLASLWRVPDRATMVLMRRFYSGILSKGLPAAAALREAQAAMRAEKQRAAPYYWAGFTLQGEWK